MKKLLPLLLAAQLFAIDLQPGSDVSMTPDEHIVIQNRVLLKINGKALSVMDVVRKMDMIFFQQYPNLVGSTQMRYQFYQANWNTILAAMIDDQLIVADAKDKRVTASDGEIRESMERIFGQDTVIKLDELGVTHEEAYEMVRTDLIVQKLTGGMVHAKALTGVNPKKMRQLYEKMQRENPPQDLYRYQVLSFRGELAQEHAKKAHELLTSGEVAFALVPDHVEGASLSQEYSRNEKDISKAHKQVLSAMEVGAVSPPVQRKNVCYLFQLADVERQELPAFAEMEVELKNRVLQEEIIAYNEKYRTWLRKRFGLTDKHLSSLVPDDLQPFALR
ncbi:MAG: hypothetical protein S4CHLAM81_10340 [Chlamydiales bacterium]|nr:hypothetical protein [Chlamydiales bacterium]MCH9635812.1 hypothetical protein [Chlamydiales bacterium]MCH9703939.1 peptidyl-prolyl cis-trans isomerase [Chlamydiota bacterium]